MKKITESGVNSVTFRNALAKAKREAERGRYSFFELIEDVKISYYLTKEETKALTKKIVAYCKKNYLYIKDVEYYERFGAPSFIYE